ncbi:MAG TPA: 3-hydroxyacyl-CoA dehydrogenase NAD-binding domain-containing protein [Candidatus Limnocylindria bacterium]|nr:3-hydroxyacyl-CoA dehydrogenase NAD-binding domain-containing protein [Candidatus Limnocylindria bacterium]
MTVVDVASIQAAGARFEPGADGVGRIVIDRPTDSVNAIDPPLLAALLRAVADARAAAPRGLVLWSAKPDQFVGGADLSLLTSALSAADISEASRAMQRVVTEIAALPFVTVAAINGSALGGGCELALACDWRVAADAPSVRVGLPEISLGLLPAGGGTQRLPRLVGLPRALDLILNARRLGARRALRAGLVDEVVHPAALERAARDRALRGQKRGLAGGATAMERAATWLAPARAIALRQARDRVSKEAKGHYPAPLRAIEAIATGLAHGMERGMAVEAEAFGELATGTVARNLIVLFLSGLKQRRSASADLPDATAPRDIAVVGAGLMGSGIAQSAALAGMTVRLRDVDDAAISRGLAQVRSLTEDAGRKGVVDRREARRAIARVTATTDWTGFARSELVIEAVFEELELKRRVLAEIEAAVPETTVIASNTSALPIADLARDARHPERVVGMHFFSPVHRMQLIEIVRPRAAAPVALARAISAGQALGKTVIVVRDGPGFYTTRVIGVMLGEATRLLYEGARIEDVDAAMTAYGWPIGPFALMDEVGLAVARHAGETVAAAVGADSRANAVQVLTDAGLTGKRGGEGFYRYDGKKRTPNDRVYELLGARATAWREDVAERLTALFTNAAARCLDEGVLRTPAEGDLGAVLGLGFPPFLGGPFRYADARGAALRDMLRALAERHGPHYQPADGLASGRRYHT